MNAFKGCTNIECKAYKKIHYKNGDQFCLKCGSPLSYVCAECWKVLESNEKRFCIICQADKEQKKAQTVDSIKNNGAKAVAAVAGIATVVVTVAKDADKITEGAKKIVGVATKAAKLIKK